MRRLIGLSRRRFGQSLGAALALAGRPDRSRGHAAAHAAEVRIAQFAFVPSQVEIVVGDSVTWVNDDAAPHTATAGDGAWDTGGLERGSRGEIAFDRPGTFAYLCAYHPQMRGTVIVRPKAGG